MAAMPSKAAVHDHVALAEIELCGELIIAASAAEERLSVDRIDEVLRVRSGGECEPSSGRPPAPGLA